MKRQTARRRAGAYQKLVSGGILEVSAAARHADRSMLKSLHPSAATQLPLPSTPPDSSPLSPSPQPWVTSVEQPPTLGHFCRANPGQCSRALKPSSGNSTLHSRGRALRGLPPARPRALRPWAPPVRRERVSRVPPTVGSTPLDFFALAARTAGSNFCSPQSCRKRGACPSCNDRRMQATALLSVREGSATRSH